MTAATVLSTANLGTITRTADAQAAAKAPKASSNMGKDDFLRLFTTQLTHQDPTDPVKNEAFVAQLAQFSQLESLTNMTTSLDSMSSTLQGDRLMNASSLIGKSVQATNIPGVLVSGNPINASISLPSGADNLTVTVTDANGNTVRTEKFGSQQPGPMGYTWDGKDDSGKACADGAYNFTVSATVAGKSSSADISLVDSVRSVTVDSTTKELQLSLSSGATVPMSSVLRLGS